MGVALVLASSRAWAKDRARLELDRTRGAERCPDAAAFERMVAERLGSNPFRSDASTLVRVSFRTENTPAVDAEASARELAAEIALVDATGIAQGRRLLRSGEATCAELADKAVLTVTLLLESTPRPDDAPPAPPVPPDPRPALETGPPAARRESDAVDVDAFAGALLGLGSSPNPAFGVQFGAGIHRRPWSFRIEGRLDVPTEETYPQGTIRTALRVGQFVGCGHLGPAFGCGVVGMGALSADGKNTTNPRHTTALYAHVGARLGIEQKIVRFLHVYGHVDLLVPLTRTTAGFGATDVWTSSDVAGAFGVGFLGRFP